jgi:hypothetical protein
MTKPGSGGPRLNSFDPKQQGPMRTADNRVAMLPVPRATNRGTMEEGRAAMPAKRRPLFNQRYYQQSTQHPDNLFGNPDARRNNIGE